MFSKIVSWLDLEYKVVCVGRIVELMPAVSIYVENRIHLRVNLIRILILSFSNGLRKSLDDDVAK